MNHLPVEGAVMEIYRRVTPSRRLIDDPDSRLRYQDLRRSLHADLALPAQLFAGRRLIDVGGGTGENSLHYATLGARVTIADPNEISLGRAEKLFSDSGLEVETVQASLFDLDHGFLSDFDLVCCEGVVHHTHDPLAAVDHLCRGLADGAMILVALAESSGWFKRRLQREVVRRSGRDEEGMVVAARCYFSEHIDRAVRFGQRTAETVIYDTFVNPVIDPRPLRDILGVFRGHGVRHHSAWPRLAYPFDTRPRHEDRDDLYDYDAHADWFEFLQRVWRTCGEEELGNAAVAGRLAEFERRLERDDAALVELERRIMSNRWQAEDLAPLQHGYLGVGLNYFVGVKSCES